MDNASEHVLSKVQHAHTTAAAAILQHIARTIGTAVTGPAVLSAPLFKAGKPPSKYATVSDGAAGGAGEVVEFKEVVVTAKHTHKLVVKVSYPKPQQQQSKAAAGANSAGAAAAASTFEDAETSLRRAESSPPPPRPKVDVRVEWTNALASVVSVDALFDNAPAATAEDSSVPAAVFTVMFLCPNKDAKAEDLPPALAALKADMGVIDGPEPAGDGGAAAAAAASAAAAQSKQQQKESAALKKEKQSKAEEALVACMTRKRTAFEWAMLALRRATEQPIGGGEAQHLRAVFQRVSRPSLRCRAYLVPDALGGAAQRDEWVSVYRAAIQNYWQERLEATVIAAPEVFQWCCWAQYAGPQRAGPPAAANHDAPLPGDSLCLLAISTQRLYIINAKEANILAPESGKISPTAARAVDVGTVTAVEPHSYTLQLDFQRKAFAFLHFFCAQHAADFVLELQRVFEMVRGQDAEFPIVK